jgi:hypothetical protein
MNNLYFQKIFECNTETFQELDHLMKESSRFPYSVFNSSYSSELSYYHVPGGKYESSLCNILELANLRFRLTKSKVFLCIWKKCNESPDYIWHLCSYENDLETKLNDLKSLFPLLSDKFQLLEETSSSYKFKKVDEPPHFPEALLHFKYYLPVLDVIKIKNGEYVCGDYWITSYIPSTDIGSRRDQADDDGLVLSSEFYIQPLENDDTITEELAIYDHEQEISLEMALRLKKKKIPVDSKPVHVYSVFANYDIDEDVDEWYTEDPNIMDVISCAVSYEEDYGDQDFYLYYMHVN